MKSIRKKGFWRAFRRGEVTAYSNPKDYAVLLSKNQYRVVKTSPYIKAGTVYLIQEY